MKFSVPETEEVSINLTPLIDIVFLLLIFFMVSTTFQRETELEIALPEASAETSSEPIVSALILEIDATGAYRLSSQQSGKSSDFASVNIEQLSEMLKGLSAKNDTATLVIKADAKTPHQAVVQALDAARKANLTRVKFAAEVTAS
ncbi:MAG: ExbD/TolR family protein [Arenicellales bacterium]